MGLTSTRRTSTSSPTRPGAKPARVKCRVSRSNRRPRANRSAATGRCSISRIRTSRSWRSATTGGTSSPRPARGRSSASKTTAKAPSDPLPARIRRNLLLRAGHRLQRRPLGQCLRTFRNPRVQPRRCRTAAVETERWSVLRDRPRPQNERPLSLQRKRTGAQIHGGQRIHPFNLVMPDRARHIAVDAATGIVYAAILTGEYQSEIKATTESGRPIEEFGLEPKPEKSPIWRSTKATTRSTSGATTGSRSTLRARSSPTWSPDRWQARAMNPPR